MIEKLSVSILDIDILKIDQTMLLFERIGIKNIHIDIIDSSFTENISFGLSTVKAFLKYKFNFSIHLMVENPIPIIKRILENNQCNHLLEFIVHSHFNEVLGIAGISPVLAINPDQSIDDFKNIIYKFKSILIMTVFPGFGGQKLIEDCLNKVTKAKSMGFHVMVDGGINKDNIKLVNEADCIVVGSAITCSCDIKNSINEIIKNM